MYIYTFSDLKKETFKGVGAVENLPFSIKYMNLLVL